MVCPSLTDTLIQGRQQTRNFASLTNLQSFEFEHHEKHHRI